MTGFGDAATQHGSAHYSVELRCVNNRYFKASIHLPDELAAMEPELESQLRKKIYRGTVTLKASFFDSSASAAQQINEAALRQYLTHLEHVERQAQSPGASHRQITIDLAGLLSLPGVVQNPSHADLVARARPVLVALTDQACEKMLAMRQTEGRGLADDLQKHLGAIGQRLGKVEERAPFVVREYCEKLRTRVADLLSQTGVNLDDTGLAREVAIFAERCDISEELQRLRAHLVQFAAVLGQTSGEPAGRTLDFLSQEMLREANTIASKSNDAAIAHTVVEVKGAIDRIKEQAQNVE